MSKLILIDGNAMIHRAYHAMPKLTTPQGEAIGATQGFINMLFRIISDLKPTHLAVCWDRKEPTFRNKMYKEYQSQRPPLDDDLSSQFKKIKDALDSFNIKQFEKIGFEADDIIGTLSKKINVDEVVIVTGDKDQFQLVNKKVKVYMPVRGIANAQLFGEKEVKEKMGVSPERIVDLKALIGDPSDNYPGVFGIGPKTAVSLLDKYGDYKNIYKNIDKLAEGVSLKLKAGKEGGDMSLELAKIVTDLDLKVKSLDLTKWDLASEKTVKLFKTYGFNTLTNRVKGFLGEDEENLPTYKKNLGKFDLEKIVTKIAKVLGKRRFAIRGTACLVLQGIEMVVDDIDIICDKKTALEANKLLKNYLVKEVKHSKTKDFDSYFGEFNIDGFKVEIMGEWEIKGNGKKYNASKEEITLVKVQDVEIPVTKIETELSMFAAMGRWNAFHKIKKEQAKLNQRSLF